MYTEVIRLGEGKGVDVYTKDIRLGEGVRLYMVGIRLGEGECEGVGVFIKGQSVFIFYF